VPNRKFFLPLLLAFTVTVALAASAAQASDNPTGYSYARIVRLSFVAGDVQIVRTDKSNKWEPAVLNMPVEQGFAIGTNNGRAEIELEHGSTIWLAENSVLQFTELALSNGGRITRMTLSEGTAAFQTSLSSGDTFEVATPSFRAVPAKSCEFRIDLRDKARALSVFNGKVSVNDSVGTQDVPKGATLAMKGKSSENALLKNASSDEFDHWVSSRSSAEVSGETQAALYTDAPFTYGMADLSAYGAWNYFPSYGLGWQPWGMTAGWAPFVDGQWMFYPSLGWSWISAEPWGWVPYHFGGWNYDPLYGWMWMPGDYGMWTAAPVQWVNVGNRVGWMPRPGSTLHPGSAGTRVIVSTKKLGKEGTNRVYDAAEVSGRMQAFAAAPVENGKPGIAGSIARVIVPTAGTLGTFRAALSANPVTKLSLNNAGTNANSLHTNTMVPAREFEPANAGVRPSKMPSRPPLRAAFTSPEMGGFSAAQRSGGTAATPAATSSRSVSMPVQTSHPSAAGGAAGKPH